MTTITLDHINELIAIEKKVAYDIPPPVGQEPFICMERNSPVLISAPHGARTFRNSEKEIWHEEDEYTAGMALLLAELSGVSALAMIHRCDQYDPNFSTDEETTYKQAIGRMLLSENVRFVIDVHGAALNSPTLDAHQTIDLGIRQNNPYDPPSMCLPHIEKLEALLSHKGDRCNPSCFIIGRNKFPGAGEGTISTFASRQRIPNTKDHVQSIQIEMKPQVRIAQRFPSATLYKSCGLYQAEPECVMHMLQSLVDFINYLKQKSQTS